MTLLGYERSGDLLHQGGIESKCPLLGSAPSSRAVPTRGYVVDLWLCCCSDTTRLGTGFFCSELGHAVGTLINPMRRFEPSQTEELILQCKQGTEQLDIAKTFIAH